MTDKLLVNGPIASFRLEGSIDGNKKVLYLFGDYHKDVKFQTECTDIKATEIKDYLINNFENVSNSKNKVDFFFEIMPIDLIPDRNVYHEDKTKYIETITKLFQQSFNFNFEKNKILSSKLFPSVRLHYMDIRDYLEYQGGEYNFMNIMNILNYPSNVNMYQINLLKDGLSVVSSHVKSIYDYLYPNKKGGSTANQTLPTIPTTVNMLAKYNKDAIYKRIHLFLDKIRLNYKNNTVKSTLNTVLDTNVHDMFDKYFNNLIELFKYLNSIQADVSVSNYDLYIDKDTKLITYGLPYDKRNIIFYTIQNKLDDLFTIHMNMFVMLTDVYFIRRFLDKSYITNGVIYTGMFHTIHYIYILVKYFDFKITHHSYLKGTVQDLYKLIKETSDFQHIQEFLTPPVFSQCSDLSGFPKMFQ